VVSYLISFKINVYLGKKAHQCQWLCRNFESIFKNVWGLCLGKTKYIWYPDPNLAGHRDRTL